MRVEENWTGRLLYLPKKSLLCSVIKDLGEDVVLGGLSLTPSSAVYKNPWLQLVSKKSLNEKYKPKSIRRAYKKYPFLYKNPNGNWSVKSDVNNSMLFSFFPKSLRYLGIAKKIYKLPNG